ncbi:hypothetical protein N5079_26135 [Planotetraspora sp. A-T 1434]|uniref:hypothetical protein n=1 Tax=Planotetraspora sp. A-T 1434 TaxID=2979219 RepID=UPI0021C07216|nr:hypothetical protein [Planotetraspora sp. A-T 1434]MCT9933699.1 hypothetical protein [Planotetraspora sp. A-T 1434]
MEALANSYIFWIALILLLLVVYLLPTLIGLLRGVENFALLSRSTASAELPTSAGRPP